MTTAPVTVTANKFDPNTQTYSSPTPTPTTPVASNANSGVPTADQNLATFLAGQKTPAMNASNIGSATPLPIASPYVDPNSYTSHINSVVNDLNSSVAQNQANVDALNKKGADTSGEISTMQSLLGGKSTDTQKIYNEQGVNTAYNQIKDYNAQAIGLANEAKAIPIQIQNESAGQGVTDAGVAPIQSARLRDNALKALTLGQLAAVASANYDKAKNYADQIIDAKYSQIEADIKAKQTNLAALKDFQLSPAQDKLKTAQEQALQYQMQQLQDQKDKEKDINSLVIEAQKNSAPTAVISAMQSAGDVAGALKAAGNYLATVDTDVIKLDNGNTIMVNKRTGQIIKSYGGSGSVAPSDTTPTVIRTVQTSTGNVPVDGYTLKAGDDPYFIAKNYGVDMDKLKQLNPNISDWTKLPVGAVLNVPSKQVGSGSITAVTGLSVPAFNFLTQGTTALTRMNATQRLQYMQEAEKYLNTNGLDLSTFQSKYKAYNDVLGKNISRANQTTIMANEVSASADSLVEAIDSKDWAKMGDLKAANVLKLMTGEQVNDPITTKYNTQLKFMANDLAGYLAAARGATSPELQDQRDAADLIAKGMNKKSVTAFKESVLNNESKVTRIVNGAVDSANKQVWDLFGVGNQMPQPKSQVDPLTAINSFDKSSPDNAKVLDVIHQTNPNASVQEIYDYLVSQGKIK